MLLNCKQAPVKITKHGLFNSFFLFLLLKISVLYQRQTFLFPHPMFWKILFFQNWT